MSVTKLLLPEGFNAPCADISYQWISGRNGRLVIFMHFSRVVGNPNNDLEITFTHPIALQWEEESYGLIELPSDLPRCSGGVWAYPSLKINNSKWADIYAERICTAEGFMTHSIIHYAFVAMNDLLHVLSGESPRIKLVESQNA